MRALAGIRAAFLQQNPSSINSKKRTRSWGKKEFSFKVLSGRGTKGPTERKVQWCEKKNFNRPFEAEVGENALGGFGFGRKDEYEKRATGRICCEGPLLCLVKGRERVRHGGGGEKSHRGLRQRVKELLLPLQMILSKKCSASKKRKRPRKGPSRPNR